MLKGNKPGHPTLDRARTAKIHLPRWTCISGGGPHPPQSTNPAHSHHCLDRWGTKVQGNYVFLSSCVKSRFENIERRKKSTFFSHWLPEKDSISFMRDIKQQINLTKCSPLKFLFKCIFVTRLRELHKLLLTALLGSWLLSNFKVILF